MWGGPWVCSVRFQRLARRSALHVGGALVLATGWRGVFWVLCPLAVITLGLTFTALPNHTKAPKSSAASFWAVLNRGLASNLLVNLLVAAVMMATLVVSPFFLRFGLGLKETAVGSIMAIGPVISSVSGVPSGRLVDAYGSRRVLAAGLVLLASGSFLLALLPNLIGVAGYALSITVLTLGYQLFQAANNTAALAAIPKDRRGTISGLLSLSRNTGLLAGASALGAVFALGVGTGDFAHAGSTGIGAGMRLTFLLTGGLMAVATVIALGSVSRRKPGEYP